MIKITVDMREADACQKVVFSNAGFDLEVRAAQILKMTWILIPKKSFHLLQRWLRNTGLTLHVLIGVT